MLKFLHILSKPSETFFHRGLTTRNTKSLKFLPAPSKTVGSKTPKAPAAVELDQETIELLQRLSLVGFDKEEVVKTVQDAITFADRIFEVDTTKVKPLVTLLENESLYLREDVPESDVSREELLSNAKVTQEHYFVTPIPNSEAKFAVPEPQSEIISQN